MAVKFKYQGDEVEVVPMYKYLGYHFDEQLKYNIGCEVLASSGGRALGAIISKFKDIKDGGYEMFTKLYSLGVELILDYFSSIWCNDINTCKAATNVFNRAHCYYIGLPVCTTLAGMYGEIEWMHPRYTQFLNMIRLYNRLLAMGENQISKQILYWDMNQPVGWTQAFRERCMEYGLLDPLIFGYPLPIDIAYGKYMCEQNQEKM